MQQSQLGKPVPTTQRRLTNVTWRIVGFYFARGIYVQRHILLVREQADTAFFFKEVSYTPEVHRLRDEDFRGN